METPPITTCTVPERVQQLIDTLNQGTINHPFQTKTESIINHHFTLHNENSRPTLTTILILIQCSLSARKVLYMQKKKKGNYTRMCVIMYISQV